MATELEFIKGKFSMSIRLEILLIEIGGKWKSMVPLVIDLERTMRRLNAFGKFMLSKLVCIH